MTDHDEKLANFVAITNAEEATAKHLLEANGYDVQRSLNMFWEDSGPLAGTFGAGDAGGLSAASSNGTNGLAGASSGTKRPEDSPSHPDYVRPADPVKRQRLMDDSGMGGMYGGGSRLRSGMGATGPSNPFGVIMNPFRQGASDGPGAAAGAASGGTGSGAGGGGSSSGGGGGSSSDKAVREKKLEDMFAPPAYVFRGEFQQARQAAKSQSKLLLVNIQDEKDFASHTLNRDTWKDDTIETIAMSSFVFWQVNNTSNEGGTFCQRYHVMEFPHVAVLDPRTGRSVWHKCGSKEKDRRMLSPQELSQKLIDLYDKHSLDKKPPAPPPPPVCPEGPSATSTRNEDPELQFAIEASKLDQGGNRGRPPPGGSALPTGGGETGGLQGGVVDVTNEAGGGSVGSQKGSVVDVTSEAEEEDHENKGKRKANGGAGSLLEGGGTNTGTGAAQGPEAADSNGAAKGKGKGKGKGKAVVPLEEEPAKGDPDATRLQLRFPSGKRVVRSFRKSSLVAQLFLFVGQQLQEEEQLPNFDLRANFPGAASLRPQQDRSFEDCQLVNAVVMVKVED